MTERKRLVEGMTVNLDGQTYTDTLFKNCVLVYSGGGFPVLDDCTMSRCSFKLDGAADRTLAFLRFLAQPQFMGPDAIKTLLGIPK